MKLMKKTKWLSALYVSAMMLSLIACSGENPTPTTSEEPSISTGKYVIVAKGGENSYLVTAESLDEGEVSIQGNGMEVIGGTYWIYRDNHYLFGLVYNKQGKGTGASYYLNGNGIPSKKFSYEFNRITTYGFWGDKLITASTGNGTEKDDNGNFAQNILFNYISTADGSTTEGSILAENYLGNGEKISFAGLVEANGWLYTSVIPMGMSKYGVNKYADKVTNQSLVATKDGGSGSGSYVAGEIPSTQYPDHAYIAIYKGNDFSETPTIVETDKMGFACGRNRSQYYQTIGAADNGDLYVFSSGYGRTFTSTDELKKVTGTKPSAVMRIKKGETKFDESYYVDIETLGNKVPLFKAWHISGDMFLLQMYDGEITKQDVTALSLAIYNGESKQLIPVTGLPQEVSGFGNVPFFDNGFCYIPVTTTAEGSSPALYKINPKDGKAVKGLVIKADGVSAVGYLNPTSK